LQQIALLNITTTAATAKQQQRNENDFLRQDMVEALSHLLFFFAKYFMKND